MQWGKEGEESDLKGCSSFGASVSLAAKLRLKVPRQSVLLELGTLPRIPNILQGPCLQMEKGRGVGAGREGRKGAGRGSGAM